MVLGVLFRCVGVMVGRVQRMTVCHLGMMGGFFMIAAFGVLGGFAMMLGGVVVMIGGFFVMFVDVVIVHFLLPGLGF
jgi:hypothetical protein